MKLDRLPRWITGFFDRSEEPRSLGSKSFESACYLVANSDGGKVEALDFDLLGRSYYVATLPTKTDHVSVLCNGVHPYVAFVPPGSFGGGNSELTFVDPTHLAAAFSALTDFAPLEAGWLSADLTPELLIDLAKAETEQVHYWKPRRVGDVIFNNWD